MFGQFLNYQLPLGFCKQTVTIKKLIPESPATEKRRKSQDFPSCKAKILAFAIKRSKKFCYFSVAQYSISLWRVENKPMICWLVQNCETNMYFFEYCMIDALINILYNYIKDQHNSLLDKITAHYISQGTVLKRLNHLSQTTQRVHVKVTFIERYQELTAYNRVKEMYVKTDFLVSSAF